MNAMLQDECCAEADTIPAPRDLLIASLQTHDPRTEQERLGLTDAEYAKALQNANAPPCTWVGFFPDGTLRPNGMELAWAVAHWDNAERELAISRTRVKWLYWFLAPLLFTAGGLLELWAGKFA